MRDYGGASGFTDRGEQAVYEALRARLHDARVLDLGVGGGRTVALLRPLASEYVALDYAPAMVAACHARFPDVDVRVGDACDLSGFADQRFDLVVFSFNGIDAVDHAARARVLSEVHRVLRPGGLFWFSTLNLAGAGLRLRPWIVERPVWQGAPIPYARVLLRNLAHMPKRLRNYARLRPRFCRGSGWAIDTLSAHDYNLLMHYTSLAREQSELVQGGFALEQAYDSNHGRALGTDDQGSDAFWFQILARRL